MKPLDYRRVRPQQQQTHSAVRNRLGISRRTIMKLRLPIKDD